MVGGAAAGLGGVEDQPELLADPLLADHLVERARAQRRLDRPLVGVRVGRGQPREVGLLRLPRGGPRLRPSAASGGRRAAAAPTSGVGSAGLVGDLVDGALGLLGRPAEPDQALVDLVAPRRRRRRPPGAARVAAADRGAEPVAQLEDDPLGALLADAGHLGQRLDVLVGDRRPQRRRGASTASIAWASLGPTPLAVWTQLEAGLLVVVEEAEQGQRVLADHHAGRQRGLVAGAQRGQGAGRAHQLEADSPDLEDGAGEGDTGDGAADEGDHLCPACWTERASAASMRAWAPPRQMWVMARASASAASAGFGRLGEPEQPGHHRGDLGLVGAAAAGDRGLDLARGVQRDRQPAAGGDQQRDAAGLGGAHDGAEVVLGEDPLDRDRVGRVPVDPVLDAALDRDQALRQRQRRRTVRTTPTSTRRQRPPDRALDHADTAAGQAGVDPEHAHGLTPSVVRTPVRTKR